MKRSSIFVVYCFFVFVCTTNAQNILHEFKFDQSAFSKFTHDSKQIFTVENKSLTFRDILSGKVKRVIELPDHDFYSSDVIISEDDQQLAISELESIYIYQLENMELKHELHTKEQYFDKFLMSPDFKYAFCIDEHIFQKWEIKLNPEMEYMKTVCDIVDFDVYFGNSNLLVLGCKKGLIVVREINSGKLIRTFQRNAEEIEQVLFTPDGKNIIVDSQETDNKIVSYNIKNGNLNYTIESSFSPIAQIGIADTGNLLLVREFMHMYLWDCYTGQLIKKLKEPILNNGAQLSNDSSKLLIQDYGHTTIIDISTIIQ